jgi:hypothetical protein
MSLPEPSNLRFREPDQILTWAHTHDVGRSGLKCYDSRSRPKDKFYLISLWPLLTNKATLTLTLGIRHDTTAAK